MKTKQAIATLAAASMTIASLGTLAGCSNNEQNNTNATNNETTTATNTSNTSASQLTGTTGKNIIDSVDQSDEYAKGTHHAVLTVAGYDPITIELDADSAPITVSNFCKYVRNGYYDGLTFYRFQDGFCMQGGSEGNSASSTDNLTPIKGEFTSNGVDNPLSEEFGEGIVAMARTSSPDTATTTFFVTLGSGQSVSSSLNGEYAAFGKIDADGMSIIKQIVADHKDAAKSDTTGMGMISDESKQAVIESLSLID